jgi:hypothetical protein
MLVANKIGKGIEELNPYLATASRQFLGRCQSLGNSNSSVCKCLATDTTAYYITFPIDSNQKTLYGLDVVRRTR